jgi:hypothetical protein
MKSFHEYSKGYLLAGGTISDDHPMFYTNVKDIESYSTVSSILYAIFWPISFTVTLFKLLLKFPRLYGEKQYSKEKKISKLNSLATRIGKRVYNSESYEDLINEYNEIQEK